MKYATCTELCQGRVLTDLAMGEKQGYEMGPMISTKILRLGLPIDVCPDAGNIEDIDDSCIGFIGSIQHFTFNGIDILSRAGSGTSVTHSPRETNFYMTINIFPLLLKMISSTL